MASGDSNTSEDTTFGASFADIFAAGVKGYLRNIVPLSLAAGLSLGVYLVFRFPAQDAFVEGDVLQSLGLDLIGLMLGSIFAYPWYCYALSAADGERADLVAPLRNLTGFSAQIVASFWFWAAVMLGLRYLFGIPSILAVLFYAFYGFAIADGVADGGLKALGYSVRVGEGKRIGLFALAGVFLIFNLFGAIAVGYEVTTLTIGLAIVGLMITTSITMVAGGRVYRLLQASSGVERRKGRQ